MNKRNKYILISIALSVGIFIYIYGKRKVIIKIDGQPAAGEVFITNGTKVEEFTFKEDGSLSFWSLSKRHREVYIKDMKDSALQLTFPKSGTISYSIDTLKKECTAIQKVNLFQTTTTKYKIK